MGNYLNEHKAMRVVNAIPNMDGSYKVYQYGTKTVITNLKNIKGFNYIYNSDGAMIATELKISSIVDENYLDVFVRFDVIETNVPVFYHKTGMVIDTDFLNEMCEDIEIGIVSNYMSKYRDSIKKGDVIKSKEYGSAEVIAIVEDYGSKTTLLKCVNAMGFPLYLDMQDQGNTWTR